jgi:hypothetical protein
MAPVTELNQLYQTSATPGPQRLARLRSLKRKSCWDAPWRYQCWREQQLAALLSKLCMRKPNRRFT